MVSPPTLSDASLSDDDLRELALFLRLGREFELRFEKLFRTGDVPKWYSGVGNEGIAVGAASAIDRGDALFTLHRDSGAILRYYLAASEVDPDGPWGEAADESEGPRESASDTLYRLSCQLLGRADGYSAGYERSYHYARVEAERGLYHFGMISHLGAMLPVAAGVADAFRRRGSDRVALAFLGDGATSTGDFHESLNLAGVYRAPLVVVIENNGWAFSTPLSEQTAARSLASRAEGYGIAGETVDGHDPAAVLLATRGAVERARRGEGATLIEAVVGRIRGHSEGDDSLSLVPADVRERAAARDPVAAAEAAIVRRGLATEAALAELAERCATLVTAAADRALAAPPPDPSRERPVHAE